MKKLIRGLFVLIMVVANNFSLIHAQQLERQVDEMFQLRNHLEKVYSKNPQQRHLEKQAAEQLYDSFKDYSQRMSAHPMLLKSSSRLIIPVVIHNIYEAQSMDGYVNDDRVHEAIQMLNDDYNLNNEFRSSIIDEFKDIEGDAGIEFRLAQIDPNGKHTTGITRHQSWLTMDGSWEHPEVKRICSWPREKYLNIWVVYSSDGENGSAWAYLPSQVADGSEREDLDGIVISEWALGKRTPGYYSTLTHEIGHFLGLEHTWGSAKIGSSGACDTDDGINDTPDCNGYGVDGDHYYISCGSLDNVQNFMELSKYANMYTMGQVSYMRNTLSQSVADRNNLCTRENYQETLIFDEPHLIFSNNVFEENIVNDGRISATSQLTLHNIEFALTGKLTKGVDFDVVNVPSGLSVEITVNSTSRAVIELIGNAQNHLEEHSIDNLTIVLKKAALNGDYKNLMNPDNTFAVQFKDLAGIVYHPYDDVYISIPDNKIWNWFVVPGFSMDYGAYINSILMLQTYQKPVVCEAGTHNISLLQTGDVVGPDSYWEAEGEDPDLHIIYNSGYTVWKGQTGYMGIKLWKSDGNGEIDYYYGYLELRVDADATGYEVLGVGYNPVPGQPIVVGVAASELIVPITDLYESDDNDGSIITNASLRLLSDQFSIDKGGFFEEGTHFSVSNLPAGLTVSVYVDDANNARIYINGNAVDHESVHSCNVGVIFENAAFLGGDVAMVANSSLNLALNFRDEYQIVYVDVEDFTVSSENSWQLYKLGYRDASFGVWYDNETNTSRIELYKNEGVSVDMNRNLVPLSEGTVIHEGLHWVAGGGFPEEHNVSAPTYSDWNGLEGYVGMRFAHKDQYFYGWAHIQVAADGQSYTIFDYAFNETLGEPIVAGRIQTEALVTLASDLLQESKNNDGTFDKIVDGELFFCDFAKSNSTLVEGEDFVVTGLPDGITIELNTSGSKTFSINLSGQMAKHERINSTQFEIVFQDVAFSGINSDEVAGYSVAFQISCFDVIDIDYVNMLDQKVDAANTWYSFYLHNTKFGIFFMDYEEETTLRFETYTQRMICASGTINLKPLPKGTVINKNSAWVAGGNYPDLHVVYSSEFTQWAGQTAYAGIEVVAADGIYYGWLRFHVAEDGSSYQLLDYVIQNIPGVPIITGEVDEGVILLATDRICDDATTKQFSESIIDLELNGAATFVSGSMVEDQHYMIQGLPTGFTASIQTVDNHNCQLIVSGDTRDYYNEQIINLEIEFTSEAFVSHVAADIAGAILPVQLSFEDPYDVNTKSYIDFSVGENYTWENFNLIDDFWGGLWYHSDSRSLFLEMYDDQVVCQPGTQNIILLEEDEAIGPDLTWESQGVDFPGQHLAYSDSYTELAGKEGYAGVRVQQDGKWHYGWIRLSINETGTRLMTTGFGICLRPETTIPAGHTSLALFSADKTTVQMGETIMFSDESLTPSDEWTWYFEGADQTGSIEQNPQVTYSVSGVYRVMLTVNSIEVKGASVVYEDYVYVE